MMRRRTHGISIVVLVMAIPAAGQTPYKRPPEDVVAILDAPRPPLTIVSPRRDAILRVEIQPYPTIEFLAEPVLRLAGLRINPRGLHAANHPIHGHIPAAPGWLTRARIALPAGSSIHPPIWSHDGKKMAFSRDRDDGVELWVADVATGEAKPIPKVRLNDVLSRSIRWLSNNRHILTF